jgi:hypothetical protein
VKHSRGGIVTDDSVVITNGDSTVELPARLASLLIGDKERGWKKGRAKRAQVRPPAAEEGVAERNTPDANDDPIPMTHIPGVVPGVSMKAVRELVNSGAVPVTVENRKKLVRPSDVLAAIEAQL